MKKIIAKFIRGMIVVLSQLPLKFHYFMGDVFAWIAMNLLKYRFGMVWMNLSRAFPEKKYKELKSVVKDFYRHFGEIIAETIWFGGSDYRRLVRQGIVEIRNPEVLNEMYDTAPSVTILNSHCGNWEILGGMIGYMGAKGQPCSFTENDISVVYKRLSSEVADYVFGENRLAPVVVKYPTCRIEAGNILRFAISNRNSRRVYVYPADQSPGRGTSHYDIGNFLNQQTYAVTGSVGIACKLSHAVVYMKMRRVRRGKYEVEFIPICMDASKSSIDEIIRAYYSHLEEEIRETPANWLWSHNRWKMY